MKCAYKHCKHGGEVEKDQAVKVGNRYYHADCLKEKETVKSIIDLYHEMVDPKPIENYLRKTVNDLIYKDGNDASFILFAIRFCLDNGWTLRSPGGLRYVAKDWKAKEAWKNKEMAKLSREIKIQMPSFDEELDLPEIKQTKSTKKKISTIIGV